MPPTPTRVMRSPTRAYRRRSTSRERSCSGAPDRPPVSAVSDGCGGQAEAVAGDGGVGGDDAVQAQLQGEVGDRVHVLVGEVGGDLDQQRDAAVGDRTVGGLAYGGRAAGAALRSPGESRSPGVFGRGDVDDEVVGVGGEALGGGDVVGDGLVLRDHLGLADVDADDVSGKTGAPGGQPRGDGGRALVVEAHPVDQRAVGRRAGRGAARGLPGWGCAGDRADLDVVEAEHRHAVDGDGVLVEAGGQPEGAGHAPAQRLDLAAPRSGAPVAAATSLRSGASRYGEPDPAEGQVVGLLGVHPREDGAEEEGVHAGRAFASVRADGLGRAESGGTSGSSGRTTAGGSGRLAGRGQMFRVFLE